MIKRTFIFGILIFFFIYVFPNFSNQPQNNKTILKFASWGSKSELQIIKPLINEFEINHPNIKIEFLHIPQNYFQKIHLLFASNLAPDVLFINNLNIPMYANHLEPLDSLVDKSLFYPQAISALSYNQKLLAVPRDISTLVLFYNKDIFDKKNIPYPKNNWRIYELLDTATKLTDAKTFGISFDTEPIFYLPYLTTFGGGIINHASTIIINNKQSQDGLNFYIDLRKKHHVAPTEAEKGSETSTQMFLNNRLGMLLSGRWIMPKLIETKNLNFGTAIFPLKDDSSFIPLDASGWAISKNSQNKESAKIFIQFMSSKENINKIAQTGLIVPARLDCATDFIKNQNDTTFIETIKYSKNTPVDKNYKKLINSLKLENQFN